VVSSSHNHTDHLYNETLMPLLRVNRNIEIVAPAANEAFVAKRLEIAPDRITSAKDGERIQTFGPLVMPVASAHDRLETDDQGRHRFLGYVFRLDNGSILYHSGDTIVYEGLADRLRPFAIDIAILPINGKVGNMSGRDAANLAKEIGAKLVIPCHYDMFEFNTADPREQFVPECERIGQPYRVLQLGERFSYPEKQP
jgi:L-ascorbate metabolism protein UlaG (beta-lactamase superfamily)